MMIGSDARVGNQLHYATFYETISRPNTVHDSTVGYCCHANVGRRLDAPDHRPEAPCVTASSPRT
eukprot:383059-Hanusia_phi.AAC.1